ncbi:MAG: hypothetical protein JWN65_998 [Solirubrobacterales bacterium]|nr:hypothetical protein [Solirubrobacterales bacterium]
MRALSGRGLRPGGRWEEGHYRLRSCQSPRLAAAELLLADQAGVPQAAQTRSSGAATTAKMTVATDAMPPVVMSAGRPSGVTAAETHAGEGPRSWGA